MSKVMCISRNRNNRLEIDVDGQQVQQVSQSTCRYLGGSRMDIAQKRFGVELRWQRK